MQHVFYFDVNPSHNQDDFQNTIIFTMSELTAKGQTYNNQMAAKSLPWLCEG